jgi:hypothetical protein
MHDTLVKLKDGRTFCGPIWTFRPQEGYMEIVDAEGLVRVHLDNIESAVTKDERVGPGITGDVDELERARKHGWEG